MENEPVENAPVLYRIGRMPDPLELPPYEYCGNRRFDDPLLTQSHPGPHYRVLYLGETRLGCFIEVLQGFRPDLAYLARIADIPDGDDDPDLPSDTELAASARQVSARWLNRRGIQSVSFAFTEGVYDLRQQGSREQLRSLLTRELLDLGVTDVDLSTTTSSRRPVTQIIGRTVYESGSTAIRYVSRFGCEHNCLAVCEGNPVQPLDEARGIDAQGDPDLLQALALFELTMHDE